jgi:putative transposase
MKGKRYSEEQIIGILRELDGGKALAEVCRQHGVSQQSVYRWRSKYADMGVSDLRRLKELESENRRLKHVVAEQALDIAALKEVVGKKW